MDLNTSVAEAAQSVVTAAKISCAGIGRRYVLAPTAFFSCGEHGLPWHVGFVLSSRLSISHSSVFLRSVLFEAPVLCRGHIPFAQQSATCVETIASARGAAYVPVRARRKIKLVIRRTIGFRPLILLRRWTLMRFFGCRKRPGSQRCDPVSSGGSSSRRSSRSAVVFPRYWSPIITSVSSAGEPCSSAAFASVRAAFPSPRTHSTRAR